MLRFVNIYQRALAFILSTKTTFERTGTSFCRYVIVVNMSQNTKDENTSVRNASQPWLVAELLYTIFRGFMTSLNLKETLRFLNSTRRIETVSSLLLLNGFIFGGSLALWEWAVLPLLDRLGSWALISEKDTPQDAEVQAAKAAAIQFVTFLWLAPMLLLSVLLNMVWYNDIAEDAFRKRNLKLKRGAS